MQGCAIRFILFILGLVIIYAYLELRLYNLGVFFWFIPLMGLLLMGFPIFGQSVYSVEKTTFPTESLNPSTKIKNSTTDAEAKKRPNLLITIEIEDLILNKLIQEFRTTQGLELINNFNPDNWQINDFEADHVVFENRITREHMSIKFPFLMGTMIFPTIPKCFPRVILVVKSIRVERYLNLIHSSRINTGIDIEIEKEPTVFSSKYYENTELSLFEDHWKEKHGNSNIWFWEIGFNVMELASWD